VQPAKQQQNSICDFSLSPPRTRDLLSSGILSSVEFRTEVSGQPLGPIFIGFSWPFEDGTDSLS
jgi:hypothetical protein